VTRKDFELIADAIQLLPLDIADRQVVAEHFAKVLTGTNDRFDRDRFIKAATAW
jgi:hypothetical protein